MRLWLTVAALAIGCGSTTMDPPPGNDDPPDGTADASNPNPAADAAPVATSDFYEPGPSSVDQSSGSFAVNGCSLAYDMYTPTGGPSAPLVVLGHGFSRGKSNVAGIAEHIASYGVRVVAPNYCHSSAFDTDYAQNAADAVALSQELAGGAQVIHAGHSAGGLSALVAATDDTATMAVLGLDMTDADSLGASSAQQLSMPALGLVGDSSDCNSSGNGRAVFGAMSGATTIHVLGATHCDFEEPTSGLCTSFCGGSSADRLATVRALAAAFIAWQTGTDASGQQWVTAGGSELSRLESEGLIQLLP